MSGSLVHVATMNRVRRALRSGDAAAAIKLASNLVRFRRKDRQGWMLYIGVLACVDAPLDERLSVARKAFGEVPYHSPIFYQLSVELIQAYAWTGDRGFLAEIMMCTKHLESIMGESPESLMARSEVAQLENDDAAALVHADRAFEMSEGRRTSEMKVMLGACYWSIPDRQEFARQLLEEAAGSGRNPVASLTLGILVEDLDPKRSQALLARAKAAFPPGSLGFRDFDRVVGRLREHHRLETQRRRTSRPPPPSQPGPLWADAN